MSGFWLRDRTEYPDPINSWPLPPVPPQVELSELSWLTRELDRYVRGSIRGRSFLIAGHRGAGKTALAGRAVETVRTEIIRQSVVVSDPDLPDAPFQRPLLVKLHGPSMLELPTAAAPAPASPPAPAPAPAPAPNLTPSTAEKGKNSESTATSNPGAGGPGKAEVASADAKDPGAHAALIHMTIGLYRALAAEVSAGYRAHALELAKTRSGDFPELAAQLALNLDSGAEPAMVREYWAAIGRLARGVLWPKGADLQPQARRLEDQGLRETIALATAGQAFQVCSGQVSYTAKQVDKVVTNDIREVKADANLKDVASRLGTLGLGALTGVAVLGSQGPLAAVGSGLAVWLLGNLTVSWTRTRTRNDDQSIDYSFIRDFKPHTLDRDLPVVIARVREAGLAPVFVIDELDKVDDAPKALGLLIGRLKHLITDFGFFCFLVNRDTYEQIERAIRGKAYPPEHTFFSDRILLYPRSDAFRQYLIDLTEADDAQDQAARAIFALGLMQEARLNLTDMMRLLARAAKRRDGYVGETHEVIKPRRLVLATVQIAIDEVLRSPLLVDRMESNAAFAQLALDTLYSPSAIWTGGESVFDPSRDQLETYLAQRLGRSTPGLEDEEPLIGEADLDLLHRALVDLLDLLSDISKLQARVGDRKVIGSDDADEVSDVYLKNLPPVGVKAICSADANGTYRFLFTRDGDPLPSDAGRLTADQRDRLDFLHIYWLAFKEVVDLAGLNFDQVASTPLLTSFSLTGLDAADAALQAAKTTERADATILDHLATVERFHAEVQKQGAKLGAFLLLNRSVQRDVGEGRDVFDAVSRLVRFEGRPENWVTGAKKPVPRPLPAKPDSLKNWRDQFLTWLLPAPGEPPVEPVPTFGSLLDPIRQFYGSPRRTIYEPTYQAFLQAARGELPGWALHADLRALKAGDWSALALAAMPTRRKAAAAPLWLLVAALRALGFGRAGLLELCDLTLADDLRKERWKIEDDGLTVDDCFAEARSFASGAAKRTAGILVVETDDEPYSPEQIKGRRGVLIVHERDYGNYLPALQWLGAIGILGGQADARAELRR